VTISQASCEASHSVSKVLINCNADPIRHQHAHRLATTARIAKPDAQEHEAPEDTGVWRYPVLLPHHCGPAEGQSRDLQIAIRTRCADISRQVGQLNGKS
jgi:hypothetical protein